MALRQNDLGNDDIKQLVRRLAIPSMLAQFVNVLYSIVDRMYIGNIKDVGEIALAGAGVCGPIVTLISSFAFLIGIGGAPLMAIRMGENNREGAKKILAQLLCHADRAFGCLDSGGHRPAGADADVFRRQRADLPLRQ